METAVCVTTPQVSAFSLFLGGFDPARFFAEHWERRSLHIPGDDPRRFAHLMSPENLFDREVRRCQHVKASTRDRDGWNVEIKIQPEQALKMFRAGMTICASVLDDSGPIGEVIKAYRAGVTTAAPPHVNCYYSPDARGYGLHFDTHPVWILQVAGTKHWTVGREPAIVNPPFNVIFPPGHDRLKLPWTTIDRPDVDDRDRFMEVTLNPGDVLYMPAGAWHAARAEGSSLALTVAVGRIGTFELFDFVVLQNVQQRLREVTRRLPAVPKSALASGDDVHAELRTRVGADLAALKALVDRVTVDDLLKVYEIYAEHPDAIVGTRQVITAKEQVTWMKAAYGQS